MFITVLLLNKKYLSMYMLSLIVYHTYKIHHAA